MQRRIPAIFVETSVPRRAIEALQAACRARGHEVRIGGALYSDALGPPGSGADSYVGMVRTNVRTIVDALTQDIRLTSAVDAWRRSAAAGEWHR